ncbi:MAG: hypothetical protein HYZ42_18415 [Bacteroidetes bacterium]|nr:hypothetical protein [Bacteroidota bacterium]
MQQKLNVARSVLPAITHIDFSARVQTVNTQQNPRFHKLIATFKQQTGTGLLINTSLNVRGEPMACTPLDAYKCLMRTEMDYLVIGNFIFERELQTAWKEDDNWQKKYKMD